MSKNNTFIEINGVRYDAHSGEYIAHSYTATHKPAASSAASAPKKPAKSATARRHPVKHAAPHKPHNSQTLMRHAVKKPAPPKPQPASSLAHTPISGVAVKKSVKRVDGRRLSKAKQVPQSPLIAHFAPLAPSAAPIQPALRPQPETPSLDFHIPVTVNPSEAAPHKKPIKPRTTADLLEHALKHAKSHEQPAHHVKKQKPKRRGRVAVTAASLMLVVGFLGYQQLPSMRMEVAAAKAGFDADLPGYKPAGYTLSGLSYGSGVVASQFRSNSDTRTYTLIQKPTAWNSQQLLDNFVGAADKNYRTLEAAGRTVYVYNSSQATWVAGGVWYQLQNDGSLGDKQIVDLAQSL